MGAHAEAALGVEGQQSKRQEGNCRLCLLKRCTCRGRQAGWMWKGDKVRGHISLLFTSTVYLGGREAGGVDVEGRHGQV